MAFSVIVFVFVAVFPFHSDVAHWCSMNGSLVNYAAFVVGLVDVVVPEKREKKNKNKFQKNKTKKNINIRRVEG